jgi:ribosomal protein S6
MEKGRICREWSGVDFFSLDRENIRKLKLRPLSVPELLLSDRNEKADIRSMEEDAGIILRDFYYSYHRRPYLIRKRRFKKEDTDLSLRIPYLALPKNSVIGVIGENGTVTEVKEWGKRRLAYPINDKPEGYYVLVNFKSEATLPSELERIFGITEGIMRSIVIRHEEKKPRAKKTAPAKTEA